MSRPVCGMCMCLIDETGCGCNGQAEELMEIMESNNEPVAWMEEDGMVRFDVKWASQMQGKEPIPLYTHPADLTDEDLTLILEVLIDSYDDTNRCYLEYEAIWKNSPSRKAKLDGMKRMVDKHTHAIETVEAILRKAQEK